MTISGERTEQLDIFCRITGFTSDFLSFSDVEFIRFFHGALQFLVSIMQEFRQGGNFLGVSPLNSFAKENVVVSSTVRNPPHAGKAYKIRERIIAQKTMLSCAVGREL